MITRLNLLNFRCYPQFRLTLPEEGALFVGDNARGKTTLLEAMCVLLRLQSPRTHWHSHLATHGENNYAISGLCNNQRRVVRWASKLLRHSVDEVERVDQKEYLLDSGLLVWIGNDDMSLVRGGAESRRHYLDFLGTQWSMEYRYALAVYKRALRSRNMLLKRENPDDLQVGAYTKMLIETGAIVMDKRRELIELLTADIIEAHQGLTSSNEELRIEYKTSTKKTLSEAYELSLPRDKILGQTQVGPHRDDIEIKLDGHDASNFASEGQQRSIALALKLAQYSLLDRQTGQRPILLIDDVFGELDVSRRHALMESIPARAQTFITTTHLDWLSEGLQKLPIVNINR